MVLVGFAHVLVVIEVSPSTPHPQVEELWAEGDAVPVFQVGRALVPVSSLLPLVGR